MNSIVTKKSMIKHVLQNSKIKGYKVIRFWNYEVEQNLDAVLDTIAENWDLPSPKAGRRAGDEGNP